MSFKFGLGGPKKTSASLPKKPSAKSASAFGTNDDDDDNDGVETKSSAVLSKPLKKSKPTISQYGDLATQQSYRKNANKALEVDPSIYDYDAAWDAIKARDEAKKAADKANAEQGKSKYMENLLVARDVREKDYLRAKEKKYQREREEEGSEFAEKEKFVTGAYKKQQEELRRQEVEEKKKEEAEMKKREKDGKRDFLNRLLEQGDRKHQADVTAAAEGESNGAGLNASKETKKTDVEIAKELNAKGANIALTDDGEVADKRQLLTAGLNVMAKPKSKTSHSIRSSLFTSTGPSQTGRSANSHGARERQSQMLEQQLEQLTKRQADDEAEQQRQEEHAAKSRKTSDDISSARERYLQRKKAATAAASNTTN
jgi:coiled-coil domain-containing protein 55